MKLTINESDVGLRLDMFLLKYHPDVTRSHIKHWIEDGVVLVNGNPQKAGYKVLQSDNIDFGQVVEKTMSAEPQNIPIEIIYEDDDLAVVNKSQGMVVHPAVKNYDNTLVNALMYRLKSLSSINGVIRPGIVHRLDKDTSGLLVVAKNDKAHVALSRQIASKECRRIYWALVDGRVDSDGEIETCFGRHPKNRLKMAVLDSGKTAKTLYRVLKNYTDYTLVEFELKTGRTHQIRVHSAYINHPIVGDKLYNPRPCKFKLEGQLLHAKKIIFTHPTTGKTMEFECELPDYFTKILNNLH